MNRITQTDFWEKLTESILGPGPGPFLLNNTNAVFRDATCFTAYTKLELKKKHMKNHANSLQNAPKRMMVWKF